MKLKYRCYENVRLAYNGMGCEWSYNFFQTDEHARKLTAEDNHRADYQDWDNHRLLRRDNDDDDHFMRAGRNNTNGKGTHFERMAMRDNDWHRKRAEGCVYPDPDEGDLGEWQD